MNCPLHLIHPAVLNLYVPQKDQDYCVMIQKTNMDPVNSKKCIQSIYEIRKNCMSKCKYSIYLIPPLVKYLLCTIFIVCESCTQSIMYTIQSIHMHMLYIISILSITDTIHHQHYSLCTLSIIYIIHHYHIYYSSCILFTICYLRQMAAFTLVKNCQTRRCFSTF